MKALRIFLLALLFNVLWSVGLHAEPFHPRAKTPIYSFDGCNVKINNLAGGALEIVYGSPAVSGIYTNPAWDDANDADLAYFPPIFSCLSGANKEDIEQALNAKQFKGRWISLADNAPFKADQRVRNVTLKGKNWSGTGYTYQDNQLINGRDFLFFNFCLRENRGKKAVCMNAPVKASDRSGPNRLDILIPVLKSFEFVSI